MRSYSNDLAIGYFLGILIGLALVALVMYVLPVFISSKVFRVAKIRALGVISMAYTIIGAVIILITSIMASGVDSIMEIYAGAVVVNIIITSVSWSQVRRIDV